MLPKNVFLLSKMVDSCESAENPKPIEVTACDQESWILNNYNSAKYFMHCFLVKLVLTDSGAVQLDDGSQTFGKLEVVRGCRQSAGSASCVLTSPTHKSIQDQSTQLPNIG